MASYLIQIQRSNQVNDEQLKQSKEVLLHQTGDLEKALNAVRLSIIDCGYHEVRLVYVCIGFTMAYQVIAKKE